MVQGMLPIGCCGLVFLYVAFARFSEAILDFMADDQRATSGQVVLSQFEGHIFSAFDQLFNVWLSSKESRVSNKTFTM